MQGSGRGEVTFHLHTEMGGPHRKFDMLNIFLPPPSLYISNDWSLILQTFVSFKMEGILWDKQIWNYYLVALGIKLGIKLHWNDRSVSERNCTSKWRLILKCYWKLCCVVWRNAKLIEVIPIMALILTDKAQECPISIVGLVEWYH